MHLATRFTAALLAAPLTALAAYSFTGASVGDPAAGADTRTSRGYAVHTADSAPEASRAGLEAVEAKLGFVPNVIGIMAEAPSLVASYVDVQDNVQALGTLTPAEVNVVQLSTSVQNRCHYCTAAHTMVGKMVLQTPEDVMQAIRAGEPISDRRLSALRDFTVAVATQQGKVTDAELQAFLDAGFTRAQSLEVLANIAAKMMSNFTNRLGDTPVDAPLQAFREGLDF